MIKMSAVKRRRRNIILPCDRAETHLDVYTYLIFFPHPSLAPDFNPEREVANVRIYTYILWVQTLQTYASPATLARPPAEC